MRHKILTSKEIYEINKGRIEQLKAEHPECSGTPIVHFENQFKFLSNFYTSKIKMDGYTFDNGEAAFQAYKDLKRMAEFQNLNASKAKYLGRQVKLRPDWEEVKTGVMEEVVMQKFSHNPELKKKLLATGNRLLVEGNWWKDDVWGVSGGKGENRLGIILMQVRSELAAEQSV